MTTVIVILLALVSAFLYGGRRQVRQENHRLMNEISKLQGEHKLLLEILRCPKYGIASQFRRIRTYNLALLSAPKPAPHITRLEQDIKLEILLLKLTLWGVNNTILGTDDTAPLSRYSPALYDQLAHESDEHHENSSNIGLLFRMQDEIQRRLDSGNYEYLNLIKSRTS